MRRRRRYLRIRLESDPPIGKEVFSSAIRDSLLRLYGELGMAEADMHVIDFDESNSTGVVRCRREAVEKMRTIVAAITEVDGRPVLPSVTRVAGTIKSLRKTSNRADPRLLER